MFSHYRPIIFPPATFPIPSLPPSLYDLFFPPFPSDPIFPHSLLFPISPHPVLTSPPLPFSAFLPSPACDRVEGSSKVISFTPGRNCVTFLLICNISMWGINVFETQRSDANPYKVGFKVYSLSFSFIRKALMKTNLSYRVIIPK